jgi:hypothetical protein
MTIEEIRTAHQARPFRPFILHLVDGRTILVPHAEFLAQSRAGRVITVFNENDVFEIIDLLHVTSIEMANGTSHGRKRRR